MSPMSLPEQIATIAICIFGTMLTRFLPFLIFPPKSPRRKRFNISAKHCLARCSAFWWYTA